MEKHGFTLLELIIALGLAALFLPALVSVFSFSLRSASQGDNYSQAYTIAQEQMEAVYYLKENDADWQWLADSPENNQAADYYQPRLAGGSWQLGGKTTTPSQSDGYTATVKLLPVYRNDAGDIQEDPSFRLDPTSRKVVVEVLWKETGKPTAIQLISYISSH